ncbi:hypothetical protein AB6A40_008503 [Gnathostoma spinigerum]|uniref:Claspin n=1 Tax=Gnathostoma spinigerum TaxID=75299 RepID=A0ABD6EP89_9BILA
MSVKSDSDNGVPCVFTKLISSDDVISLQFSDKSEEKIISSCDPSNANKAPTMSGGTKSSTAFFKRKMLLASLTLKPPKISRTEEVDLAAENEKNPNDEWFHKKFVQFNKENEKVMPTTKIEILKQQVRKGERSSVSARLKIQEALEDQLNLRMKQEQKRRQEQYDRDNSVDISLSDEEEVISGKEGMKTKGSNEEALSHEDEEEWEGDAGAIEEMNEMREPIRKKCIFLDEEAEESEGEASVYDDEPQEECCENEPASSKETLNSCADAASCSGCDQPFVPVNSTALDDFDLHLPSSLSQWILNDGSSQHGRSLSMEDGANDPLLSESQTGSVHASCSNSSGLRGSEYHNQLLITVPVSRSESQSQVTISQVMPLCSGTFEDSESGSEQKKGSQDFASQSNSDDCIDGADYETVKLRKRKIVISDDEEDFGENEGENAKVAEPEKSDVSVSIEEAEKEGKCESDIEEDTTDVENDELHSSDDELSIFRRLQEIPLNSNAKKERQIIRSEFFDEEASLSGEDVGSDEDEDDNEAGNEYEAEEGDADDLPDSDEIKQDLHKQWLKQQQDEENRKLLYLQDQFLADGDLHSETDRTFRLKLRNEIDSKNDFRGNTTQDKDVNEEFGEDEEIRRKRIEMIKWKMDHEVDESTSLEHILDGDDLGSSLLSAGKVAMQHSKYHVVF